MLLLITILRTMYKRQLYYIPLETTLAGYRGRYWTEEEADEVKMHFYLVCLFFIPNCLAALAGRLYLGRVHLVGAGRYHFRDAWERVVGRENA